jgi:hypothetical protein
MSMKSAAHLKKVESAVRILQTTTGVKVNATFNNQQRQEVAMEQRGGGQRGQR